jgi:hypothetical protein
MSGGMRAMGGKPPRLLDSIDPVGSKGENMNTLDYVKARQKLWAKKVGIKLQGSKIERGDPIYTMRLENNLFQNISELTKNEIEQGDGNELGDGINPGKMQALHSSSVLGINVFEYWKTNKRFKIIAKALGISTIDIDYIQFEEKYEIFKNSQKNPNIDVNIHYIKKHIVGIECKFTEPFQFINQNSGLKEKYINDFEFWNEFPNLKELALKISPNDEIFEYLHCAQLIKHVLGMYTRGKDKSKFSLMYIFQPAYFENNQKYLSELEILEKALTADKINFSFISWQEMIRKLSDNVEAEDQKYIEYLIERYL